jgi:putative ABC transport system permease protein
MYFLSISFRNLWRRPVRSCLTAMGVAVAVATLIALVGTSQGVERAWSESMAGRGIHMLGFRKNTVEILSSTINQAVIEQISRIAGIKAATGELADLVKLETGVIGISGWPADSFLWESLQIQKGRRPGTNDPNGALLGQRLAERLGLGVGDSIPLLDAKVEVIGVFRQASVLNESAMILPLPLMQKLLGKEGKVTLINLRLLHPGDTREVATIQGRLNELYPSLSFLETKDVADANQMIGLLKKMNWSISVIALLMGVFFILNTLLMSVNERIREIGILAALGWRKIRIMAMVMFEGMLLAALGSAAGLLIGLAGLHWLASLKHLQGFIDPAVSPRFMLEVVLAATILGILGSLYPAWRTSRLRAADALKQE